MKTTARKELVLLHNSRQCAPESTSDWLKTRLWIQAHYHVQMSLNLKDNTVPLRKDRLSFINLAQKIAFSDYYDVLNNPLNVEDDRNELARPYYSRADFNRLARRLLSKSIGLVLGGGGARGISHVGVIRALEEAGIPIDMVGGTSMGACIAGLYARENNYVSVFGRAKMICMRLSSKWNNLLDLTYPAVSLLTGKTIFKKRDRI